MSGEHTVCTDHADDVCQVSTTPHMSTIITLDVEGKQCGDESTVRRRKISFVCLDIMGYCVRPELGKLLINCVCSIIINCSLILLIRDALIVCSCDHLIPYFEFFTQKKHLDLGLNLMRDNECNVCCENGED